ASGTVVQTDWIEAKTLQRQLPPSTVFVDIARFDVYDFTAKRGEKRWQPAHYVAWITPAQGDTKFVDLGPAGQIDTAVAPVRKAVEEAPKTSRDQGEPEAEKQLAAPLDALAKLVLQPLLPHLEKAERWIVCPDGGLWLVPWAAFRLPDGKY